MRGLLKNPADTVRVGLVTLLTRQRALLAQCYEDLTPARKRVVRGLAGKPAANLLVIGPPARSMDRRGE